MAPEKRFPSSEQTAEAVYQQLVAVGKIPPYVPFLREFLCIQRIEKKGCPLPQGVTRVLTLTRDAEFRSNHHRVIIWMHSEEFEYEGGERQTQIWYVDMVRVHKYSDAWVVNYFQLVDDSDLSVRFDDDGCVMYGHAPEK